MSPEQMEHRLTTNPHAVDPEDGPHCEWLHEANDYEDNWLAECGLTWSLVEGGPWDNNMVYCPACGRPLVEIEPENPEEDDA